MSKRKAKRAKIAARQVKREELKEKLITCFADTDSLNFDNLVGELLSAGASEEEITKSVADALFDDLFSSTKNKE